MCLMCRDQPALSALGCRKALRILQVPPGRGSSLAKGEHHAWPEHESFLPRAQSHRCCQWEDFRRPRGRGVFRAEAPAGAADFCRQDVRKPSEQDPRSLCEDFPLGISVRLGDPDNYDGGSVHGALPAFATGSAQNALASGPFRNDTTLSLLATRRPCDDDDVPRVVEECAETVRATQEHMVVRRFRGGGREDNGARYGAQHNCGCELLARASDVAPGAAAGRSRIHRRVLDLGGETAVQPNSRTSDCDRLDAVAFPCQRAAGATQYSNDLNCWLNCLMVDNFGCSRSNLQQARNFADDWFVHRLVEELMGTDGNIPRRNKTSKALNRVIEENRASVSWLLAAGGGPCANRRRGVLHEKFFGRSMRRLPNVSNVCMCLDAPRPLGCF